MLSTRNMMPVLEVPEGADHPGGSRAHTCEHLTNSTVCTVSHILESPEPSVVTSITS